MLKYCKLSDYRLKKVIKCFCVDIEASKTAQILGIHRNTINRLYNVFRQAIHEQRTQELRKLTGHVEVDETYFGLRRARGQATRRGRGTNKQPVFGIYERDGEDTYARLVCRDGVIVGANLLGHTDLAPRIRQAVEKATQIAELGDLLAHFPKRVEPTI